MKLSEVCGIMCLTKQRKLQGQCFITTSCTSAEVLSLQSSIKCVPEVKNALINVSFFVCVLFLLSDKLPLILGMIKVNTVRCKSSRRGYNVI